MRINNKVLIVIKIHEQKQINSAKIIAYLSGDYLAHTPGWHINHALDMKNHNTPQCTRFN